MLGLTQIVYRFLIPTYGATSITLFELEDYWNLSREPIRASIVHFQSCGEDASRTSSVC